MSDQPQPSTSAQDPGSIPHPDPDHLVVYAQYVTGHRTKLSALDFSINHATFARPPNDPSPIDYHFIVVTQTNLDNHVFSNDVGRPVTVTYASRVSSTYLEPGQSITGRHHSARRFHLLPPAQPAEEPKDFSLTASDSILVRQSSQLPATGTILPVFVVYRQNTRFINNTGYPIRLNQLLLIRSAGC